MSLDVVQSFASEAGRLLAAHDAAEGTSFASIKIRPVVGRIDQSNPESIGVYADDLTSEANFGGSGATTAILHFVVSSAKYGRVTTIQTLLSRLDRYAGSLPAYDISGGALRERVGQRLRVFMCLLTGAAPDVGSDDIFTVDVSFRVLYALEG